MSDSKTYHCGRPVKYGFDGDPTSYQRQAAIRTVLRAKLAEYPAILKDVCKAVTSYFEDENDVDEYIHDHMPDGLPADDPAIMMCQENKNLRCHYEAAVKYGHDGN